MQGEREWKQGKCLGRNICFLKIFQKVVDGKQGKEYSNITCFILRFQKVRRESISLDIPPPISVS